jgi:D-3-phosphoglycerate dehydrogenase
MKILVCDKIEPEAVERVRSAGIQVDVRADITPEELASLIPQYEGVVVRSRTKIRSTLIDRGTNLKVIVRGGVGLDNIDADYAATKGIAVLNTPAASSVSVAELTIGYLFALARRIYQATTSIKTGRWEKSKFEGSELSGKTLGIIGLGRIGQEVALRARALGMRLIAYDPFITQDVSTEMTSLDDLLSRSDYITLHLSYTDETHHMLGTAEFSRMKDGVHIINCDRGGIIDEEALYNAIINGKVAGAALDVYEVEPLENLKLISLEQVIGSPHIGASTHEAQARVGAEVASRLIDYYHKNYPPTP